MTRRIAGRMRRRWAIALIGLAACEGDPPAVPPPRPPDVAVAPSPSFQQRAHVEAFEALLPAVEAMLIQIDPPAAFALGRGPLRPPPLGRVPSDDTLERTWRDAQEIRPRFLSPERAAMLRAASFALQRRKAHLDGPPPWHGDPGWVLREARRTWSTLVEAWAAGAVEDPAPVLLALAEFVDTGVPQLGSTSAAALRGALVRVRELEAEVARRHWPASATDAAQRWSRALSEARAHLERVGSTPNVDAGQRRPDRLGRAELQKRLDVEEHVQRSAEDRFVALGPTIGHLQRLAEAEVPEREPTPRAVDPVRCRTFEPAFFGLRATQPRLARAWLDCDAALRLWQERPMGDAEFRLAALHQAVVEPLRRTRREQELPWLALLTGTIAPASQKHAQTVALAVGLGDPATVVRAARPALHAACAAAAALWVHGELGTDEALLEQLERRCTPAGPVDWVTWVVEHPAEALEGAELWRLGQGPAEVVALDRFWWMPAGLIDPLMRPAAPEPDRPSFSVHTEPVTP